MIAHLDELGRPIGICTECPHCIAIIARLQLELASQDDEEHAIYQRVKQNADAAMKEALGPCWNHLWGHGLEQLGHIVDVGMVRAERAETALRTIRGWDMLNPADTSRIADLAWLKKVVDDALRPTEAKPGEK